MILCDVQVESDRDSLQDAFADVPASVDILQNRHAMRSHVGFNDLQTDSLKPDSVASLKVRCALCGVPMHLFFQMFFSRKA